MPKVTPRDMPAMASSPATAAGIRAQLAIYASACAYALLAVLAVHHHEPWADEAQSWLLARDSNLGNLWGTLLHYEGTPGLWQTLVHALIRVGLPYAAFGFVSAALGFAAAILVLKYAPFPLYLRILLPFTYFLCYQYAIIARSYALIAPLLFAIAALYPHAIRKPLLTTMLLCLLAGVSAHGLLISACIWATLCGPSLLRSQTPGRAKLAMIGLIYWCVFAFLLVSAWPAKDAAFAAHRGLDNLRFFGDVATAGFAGAFAGNWILSLLLIGLSFPFLWRGGGWLFFLLAGAALCLFGTLVYAQLWHFGILFLAWLFAMWISAYQTRLTVPAMLALVAAVAVQCYWTGAAIAYDWNHAYSGSLAAAQYLRRTGLPPGALYAIGYPSTAIQPYFSRNLYSDLHGGAPQAYWDWSKGNTTGDPAALFTSTRRQMVLVGYKNRDEKQHWAGLLALLGYGLTQHFEGHTFWETGPFEDESYDLYRQTSQPRTQSIVNVADPAEAPQLLTGFYNIEGQRSRWTAKNFSVLLKAPPGSDRNGAELTLKLFVPDVQIRNLGAMTLAVDAGAQELASRTFSQASEYTYSAHIAAEAARSGFVVVNFRLDKASTGLNGDARELGVVVTEVGLAPASPAQ